MVVHQVAAPLAILLLSLGLVNVEPIRPGIEEELAASTLERLARLLVSQAVPVGDEQVEAAEPVEKRLMLGRPLEDVGPEKDQFPARGRESVGEGFGARGEHRYEKAEGGNTPERQCVRECGSVTEYLQYAALCACSPSPPPPTQQDSQSAHLSAP